MRFISGQDGLNDYFAFDHSTGNTIIKTTQDCQRIVDNNRSSANHLDGFTKNRDFQRFASIPASVYQQWMVTDGVDLLRLPKREKAQYIVRKLASSDWQHLRTNRPAQPYQKGSIAAPTAAEAIRR